MLPRQRGDSSVNDSPLSATILLRLQIENNNRHLRGKKRAIEGIVQHVFQSTARLDICATTSIR